MPTSSGISILSGICYDFNEFPVHWNLKKYELDSRGSEMITFEPLWDTLKEKNISTYKLVTQYELSRGTLDSLKHNRSITLNTLDQLCSMLDCDITDVIRYEKD